MRNVKYTSTRLNLKLLLSGLLLVLLAFCSSVSFAASSTATSQQEETISVPLKDWNKLKTNLIEADASIKSSNLSLSEAQSLTVKQATELNELKIINKKQGEELEKASKITTEQADSLAKASTSLDELKNEIKNNRRTEQRLRRQRDTWAISNAALFLAGALRR